MHPLLDSRQLLAFATLSRVGSFTLAAKELGLTQSAISRHVKTLESQLGCALFLRQGGGKLQLTDTGARLAHELAQGFALIERACAQARQPNPLLRLKAPSSLTLHWQMAELEAFQRQAPHVAVQLTSAWMDPDDVDFRSEPFDCAILLLSAPQHADWHTVKLFDEWLTPICAPALLGDTSWTLATLQQHELIHPTPDARDWRHWLAQCAPPDAQAWQRGKFLDSLQSGMTAAMQGHGVSIGDVALIRQDVLRGALAQQAVDDARFRVAVFLQAGHQAVAVVLGAAGHREQQGGLVDHQQGVVLMEYLDVRQRHGGSTNDDGGRGRRRLPLLNQRSGRVMLSSRMEQLPWFSSATCT
jgi:DNA-binding transcriptional LysR family regulator